MEFIDLAPFVLPGIITQVLLQAYYIKNCWEHTGLTGRQKALYIIFIAVAGLPAVAVYLFMAGNKNDDARGDLHEVEVDSNIRQGIFVVLIIALQIFALGIIAANLNSPRHDLIIRLLAGCFVTMLVTGLVVKKQHRFLYFTLPIIQIVLALLVEYFDTTASGQLIMLVVVAGIINRLAIRQAKFYALGAYALYFLVCLTEGTRLYGSISADENISYILVNMLVFSLVLIIFYSMNIQLLSNKRLQLALKTLREQSLQLEEMGALAERTRITGEIHDTVGHTLTSAVIAIEAGEKSLRNDADAALEKFLLAKEQVKRALSDLRSSVRSIQIGSNNAFFPELMELLSTIRHNTGLTITCITELKTDLLPIQQYVLLRAVKECATNSIKHGQSTEADLLVQEYKDSVSLTYTDNGIGTETITFGFGLKTMTERVQSIGGTVTVESARGEGFTVGMSIPTGVKKGAN